MVNGSFVTATATDAEGSTSEFSRCRIVGSAFRISGVVTRDGQPLANAEVRLTSPVLNRTILTNRTGAYSFDALPTSDYTVRVSRRNHTISPPTRSYPNLSSNQTNQNYAATFQQKGISGRVTTPAFVNEGRVRGENQKNGAANFLPPAPTGPFSLRGVTLTLSGDATRTVVTDNNGNYSIDNLLAGSYTLTPSKANYTFTPPSVSFIVPTANQPPIDFSGESLGLSALTGRIIYESRDGSIKAMNANGSGVVTLASATSRTFRHSSPNFSPNGGRAVYASRRSTVTRINTMNSDGSSPSVILTNSSGLSAPAFSPDGNRIAFHDAQRRLFVMNAAGGNPTQLISNCTEPDWSPDGSKLVCLVSESSSTTHVCVLSLNNSAFTRIDNSDGLKFSPRWSPDGSRIAFIRRNAGTHSIVLRQTDETNSSTVIHTGANNLYQTLAWSPDGSRLAFIRDFNSIESNDAAPPGSDNRLVTIQADGQGLLVIEDDFDGSKIDWGTANSLPTPASASPVTVQTGSVSITFPNTSGANAITTITPISPASAGTAPNGFALGNFAFEISTTATYTPPVTICVNLGTAPINFLPPAAQPRLLHNENGALVDITTSYNSTTNTLCGQANSFSPFVVAEEIDTALSSITGLVLDSNGNPMSGVGVYLTGTETREIETDSNGLFSFVNLTANGSYNVQPRQVGFLFTESSQDFVNLTGEETVVFTGSANEFQISGRVLDGNGTAVSGVTVALDGADTGTAVTDAGGNYSFTNLPADGSFSLTASNGTNSFSPPQIFVEALTNNLGDLNFTQFAPTAAAVGISGRVMTKSGRGVAKARVTLTGASGETRMFITNPFGYYRFPDVEAGQTYVITVSSKQYRFAPRVLTVIEEMENVDFIQIE